MHRALNVYFEGDQPSKDAAPCMHSLSYGSCFDRAAREYMRRAFKHNIKRIDRLLGNRHLALERVEVYQALAPRALPLQPRRTYRATHSQSTHAACAAAPRSTHRPAATATEHAMIRGETSDSDPI